MYMLALCQDMINFLKFAYHDFLQPFVDASNKCIKGNEGFYNTKPKQYFYTWKLKQI